MDTNNPKKVKLGYIQISDYKKGDALYDPVYDDPRGIEPPKADEIILPPNKEFSLTIDYPLEEKYHECIQTGKNGLTCEEVVSIICQAYHKIYDEELETTKTEVGRIPGMLNRNRTNGKYGIWGHDIGDLILHTLIIQGNHLGVSVDS